MLTAERFSAAEAYRIGLLHEIVPDEALDEAVGEIIDSLLKNGPQRAGRVQGADSRRGRPADRRRDDRRNGAAHHARARQPRRPRRPGGLSRKRKPNWINSWLKRHRLVAQPGAPRKVKELLIRVSLPLAGVLLPW
jgi:methylglutaconyl-CoA hydratase